MAYIDLTRLNAVLDTELGKLHLEDGIIAPEHRYKAKTILDEMIIIREAAGIAERYQSLEQDIM